MAKRKVYEPSKENPGEVAARNKSIASRLKLLIGNGASCQELRRNSKT